MKSMTGFAKIQFKILNIPLSIEIKTLNSKQIDASLKLPSAYRDKELEIRSILNRLERGKIDFLLQEDPSVFTSNQQLNSVAAIRHYEDLKKLAEFTGESKDNLLQIAVSLPDVWSVEPVKTIDDSAWEALSIEVEHAVSVVNEFRLHEGEILKKDFEQHIDIISKKLLEIPLYEKERIDTAKERIYKYFNDIELKDIDENRFEQEIIYYLEKLDITEEKVRLQKHISYFIETMESSESTGRKLTFIAQEMGREINTIGSKANHAQIQRIVVEMKDELEKIKEQLGNIL